MIQVSAAVRQANPVVNSLLRSKQFDVELRRRLTFFHLFSSTMILKAAPSHRFITCQQGKGILCAFANTRSDKKGKLELTDSNDGMSTDKIKHFYVTVSVVLSSVFMLLVLYGCYTYRKFVELIVLDAGFFWIFPLFRRRIESINKRNLVDARRKSKSSTNSNSNQQNDRHPNQKLLTNNR